MEHLSLFNIIKILFLCVSLSLYNIQKSDPDWHKPAVRRHYKYKTTDSVVVAISGAVNSPAVKPYLYMLVAVVLYIIYNNVK